MKPQDMIASLDGALQRRGQDVTFMRSGVADTVVRAHVRASEQDAVTGAVQAADLKLVISPTGLGAFGVPRPGDGVSINGVRRVVVDPMPIYDGGILVRIELRVRG